MVFNLFVHNLGQRTGLFPFMIALLWVSSFNNPLLRERFLQNKIYAAAISQSPLILRFFDSFFDTFPSPQRRAPDAEMIRIAEKVAEKFNPDLVFDKESFIIRNECNFFYNDVPFTKDKEINEYCQRKLRFDEGDVFVMVGKMKADNIKNFLKKMYKRNRHVFDGLEGIDFMLNIIDAR